VAKIDFEALLNREFRWPRAGDKAFTRAAGWDRNADVEADERSRLMLMMSGYKKGADLMVAQARHRFDRNILVYPIIFNYRQFLELSLKYLIANFGHTVGVETNWSTHSLGELWKRYAEVLDGYHVSDPGGADEIVAEIVAEFAKIDPNSFAFRYPVDKKGVAIPISEEQLDLDVLADVMTAAENYFSGSDGYLDSLQSAGP